MINLQKLQTGMECVREIDQIKKKYEVMLQNADVAFLKDKEALETRYNKVRMNKALAKSSMQADSKNATLCQGIYICIYVNPSTFYLLAYDFAQQNE